MRFLTLILAAALALVAGCDKAPEQRAATPPPPAATPPAPAGASAGSSTTPANIGQPSSTEKKEGANPVQGQVDPKEAVQQKDFQQRGDGAGPQSPK